MLTLEPGRGIYEKGLSILNELVIGKQGNMWLMWQSIFRNGGIQDTL